MGDRASYAIREHGRIETFYGHWGAATLLADIFWGPDVCEACIRRQEPADAWLDDVFGEAAVAMCKDTRTVAFYDARTSAASSETATRMMAPLWPGWTVRAVPLVSGVAASLGVDLLDNAPPSPVFDSGMRDLDRAADLEPGQIPRAALITTSDGTAWVSSVPLVRLIEAGPALLDALPGLPTLDEVRRALATRTSPGEPPLGLLEPDSSAAGVLALDVSRWTAAITLLPGLSAAGDLSAIRSAAEMRWPGWTVTARIAGPDEHRDLVAAPEAVPLPAQLRELAGRLLGDEAFRGWAAAWLAQVEVVVGLPLPGGAPEALPIDAAERDRRWALALAVLPLSAEDVRAACEPEAPAERGRGAWAAPYDPEIVADAAVTVPGLGVVTVRQPMVDGVPTGPSALVLGGEGALRALCMLTEAPIHSPGWRGAPGAVRLHVAPSGRGLLAIAQTEPYTLVWVDLAAAHAREIGAASRAARFAYDAPVVWAPGRDRFVLRAVDERDGRCGSGCAVEWDAESGWVGDAAARMARGPADAAAAFEADPGSPEAFTAVASTLAATEAWAALAEVCEWHLAATPTHRSAWCTLIRARLSTGALGSAVAAADQAVAVVPFSAKLHWHRAWALGRAGEIEAGALAAARAVACDPALADQIASDEDLRPLWGHPAHAPLDARRLRNAARGAAPVRARALLHEAIAASPADAEANEALIALEAVVDDFEAAWAVAEAWYRHDPVAAGPSRCAALVDVGRLDEALQAAEPLLARDAHAYLGHLQRARVAAQRGDEAAARAALEAGAAAFPASRPHPWASFEEEACGWPELEALFEGEA